MTCRTGLCADTCKWTRTKNGRLIHMQIYDLWRTVMAMSNEHSLNSWRLEFVSFNVVTTPEWSNNYEGNPRERRKKGPMSILCSGRQNDEARRWGWGQHLLLQRSTAVQVRSSVRLMPQNQPSGRGLLLSPTAWSPDQHHAAILADVSRHILGRTEGRGLGFGQLVRTHTGKCLKCQSSSDGHSDSNALCAGGR